MEYLWFRDIDGSTFYVPAAAILALTIPSNLFDLPRTVMNSHRMDAYFMAGYKVGIAKYMSCITYATWKTVRWHAAALIIPDGYSEWTVGKSYIVRVHALVAALRVLHPGRQIELSEEGQFTIAPIFSFPYRSDA